MSKTVGYGGFEAHRVALRAAMLVDPIIVAAVDAAKRVQKGGITFTLKELRNAVEEAGLLG